MDPWNDKEIILQQQQQIQQQSQQEQYISQEQFEQHQQQMRQQHQLQLQQQQQQMLEEHQNILQQQQQQNQQTGQGSGLSETAIAMIAESQRSLVENMSRLMLKLKTLAPINTTDTQNKNSPKHPPPHLNSQRPTECTTYAPSSPSEGAFARDLDRCFMIHKEPPIQESLKFTGESQLLQYLRTIFR